MAAYINRTVNYTGTGPQTAIPLNRWGNPNYTFQAAFTGAGDVSFEGTTTRINKVDNFGDAPATANWFPIAASQLTADGAVTFADLPLEAVRANIATNGGNIAITFLQQGYID